MTRKCRRCMKRSKAKPDCEQCSTDTPCIALVCLAALLVMLHIATGLMWVLALILPVLAAIAWVQLKTSTERRVDVQNDYECTATQSPAGYWPCSFYAPGTSCTSCRHWKKKEPADAVTSTSPNGEK